MQVARHQDQAERTVHRLLWLYALATGALVLCINLLAAVAWILVWGTASAVPAAVHGGCTGLLLVAIIGSAWWETRRLAEDSAHGARRLGAVPIEPDTQRLHRRLQNLIEELAIAAGIGVPRVFVLNGEPTMNALAVGMDRNQSVLIVTQGALERLTRDELQGVLAHHVARIVHGDVRLSTRVLGLNHGFRGLGLLGRTWLMRFGSSSASPTGASGAGSFGKRAARVMVVPGLILLAAGRLGEWAARAITAGIGRQRVFYADAQAVALTGQREGLGGALRKVLGMAEALRQEGFLSQGYDLRQGVVQRYPAWDAFSHLMWLGSIRTQRWYATHPSVHERVRRVYGHAAAASMPRRLVEMEQVEPDLPTLSWTGGAAPDEQAGENPEQGSDAQATEVEGGAPDCGASDWLETISVRDLTRKAHDAVNAPFGMDDALIQAAVAPWPAPHAAMRLLQATREPHGAAALVVALLQGESAHVAEWGPGWAATIQSMGALRAAMGELPEAALQPLCWPLIELAVTRLRAFPKSARESLLATARGVVIARQEPALREWSLYGLLRLRLAPPRLRLPGTSLGLDARSVRVLFALVGQAVHLREARIDRAANAAIRSLDLPPIGGMAGDLTLTALERAMVGAAGLPLVLRPRLVRGLVALLPAVPPVEVCDFIRVLCLAIDCPPPSLPARDRMVA
jgi:Zn-dependent protease with chaperone function